ncbi:MAG: hypothetical protein FJ241_08860 [Nitrospira sp.]|nr:hypothetical protein [Nitrospira sp.]
MYKKLSILGFLLLMILLTGFSDLWANSVPPLDNPDFTSSPPNDYAAKGLVKKGYYHAGVDLKSKTHPLKNAPVYSVMDGTIEDVFRTSDTNEYCDGTKIYENISACQVPRDKVKTLREVCGHYSMMLNS